ncbi:zinc transporter permease subunit ZevB [[Haemophilus] felis]|nr:zinc transporter permease subunit ZevB [[Haemophilus] felis]
MRLKSPLVLFIILLLCVFTGYFLFPYLFVKTALWQRDFNQLLSFYLREIQQDSFRAGLLLILLSFAYGVLHAIGPGHGKFVIGTYLSTHSSQFNNCIRLTLLSSLMQGIVAIGATSILVVLLNVSSNYFKLSQLWLERVAFLMLFMLGLFWCYQSIRKFYKGLSKPKIQIKGLSLQPQSAFRVGKSISTFQGEQQCGCGHQHLPNQQQLDRATSVKDQFFLILTIGMRPCSGAIFILFLAYMLDLYWWGIVATLAMSLGTGITLSAFGLLVRYARNSAIHLGHWYDSSKDWKQYAGVLARFAAGAILMFFAVSLFYGTLLNQGSRGLF